MSSWKKIRPRFLFTLAGLALLLAALYYCGMYARFAVMPGSSGGRVLTPTEQTLAYRRVMDERRVEILKRIYAPTPLTASEKLAFRSYIAGVRFSDIGLSAADQEKLFHALNY